MLVYEYVNLLVASELKPLAISNIGGDYRDETQEKNFQEIVSMLNMANKAVHEKFSLLQKEIVITDIENNKPFNLPSDFITPVSAALRDGTQIPINNERKVIVGEADFGLSIMFPEPFICLVKGEDVNKQTDISIVYVATPEAVSGPHDKINLTSTFTQAILDYVAYRAYIGVDGNMNQTNNTYYMRFISDCNLIKNNGLTSIDNLNSNVKLVERGYP